MPTLSLNANRRSQTHPWVWLVLLLTLQLNAHANITDVAPTAAVATVIYDSQQQQLDITTIDQHWRLQLKPKQLLSNVSSLEQALLGLPQFFDADIDDHQNAWARISLNTLPHEDTFTGHIFSEGELFELQYNEKLGGHFLSLLSTDSIIATNALPKAKSLRQLLNESDSTNVQARAINIGIAVDSRYNEHYDNNGLAHALSIINGVDGLYQNQLGLALVVDKYRLYAEPALDPLRNHQGDINSMLDVFSSIRLKDRDLHADLALVHLFSGHEDASYVIGSSWVNTVCNLDGTDLSISTPSPYDILLAAHEIGHNLGAKHDDESSCHNSVGNEIMQSTLTEQTRPTFSACSINDMQPARNSTCALDNIDVGIKLTPSTLNSFEQLNVTVTASNQDSHRAAHWVTSTTEFPTDTLLETPSSLCTILDSKMTCRYELLTMDTPLEATVTATLSDAARQSGAVISSSLSHYDFVDTHTENNHTSLQISAYSNDLTGSDTPENDDGGQGQGSTSDSSTQAENSSTKDDGAGAGATNPLSLICAALFAGIAMARSQRREKPAAAPH